MGAKTELKRYDSSMDDSSPQTLQEEVATPTDTATPEPAVIVEESETRGASVAPSDVAMPQTREPESGIEVSEPETQETNSVSEAPDETKEPAATPELVIDPPIQQAEAPVVMEKTDPPIVEPGQTVSAVEATAAPKMIDPMEEAKKLPHEVLEAAFTLLSMERLDAMREAKKQKDKQKVEATSARIRDFIASHEGGVRRTTIADKLNLSPSLVTDYLQRLVVDKAIRAEGNTNNRRFYAK